MFTTCTDGSISCWNANAPSSAVFQVATPPDSTPHIGSAPAKRFGNSWIRPAVMMPPSEWPHAIVRVGWPTWLSKISSVAIWSGSACSMAHPVVAYDEPASAKPWASMAAAVAGSPASVAGFGDPGVTYPWLYRNNVPFQFAGTSIFQVAPSGSVPVRVCASCPAAAEVVAARAGAAAEPRPSASSAPARVNRVGFVILNTITLPCACLMRGPVEDCSLICGSCDRVRYQSPRSAAAAAITAPLPQRRGPAPLVLQGQLDPATREGPGHSDDGPTWGTASSQVVNGSVPVVLVPGRPLVTVVLAAFTCCAGCRSSCQGS